ncbi:MAG: 30S ribosomal protein S8e [Candidatus Aenigmatarchaeota archaeon]
MVRWHLRSNRTPTGALVKRSSKKKRFQRGSEFLETKIGKKRTKTKRCRGGNQKTKLLSIDFANVADPKTGRMQKAKIISVQENPANPHYIRRNIITKGAVIKTDMGLAKVTSRPGQHGTVNAVLIEEKKASK